MTNTLGVLYAAFEAVPFMKTGGLGDVAGTLPPALKEAGCDIRVILPKFSGISQEYKAQMRHVAHFYVPVGWRSQYCGIEALEHKGVTFYFVDNEYYFRRDRAYGFYDDGERMAFFSRAILESLRCLTDFHCDILHCNDWHTALAPVFLREFYRNDPLYASIRTVFTVHNLKFQGQMSRSMLGDVLGLADIPNAAWQLSVDEHSISLMKGALCYSDALTTVSPSYAGEIQHAYYGEGMDGIFRQRGDILRGILNGIDTALFDPETDACLPQNYSAGDFGGKAVCKAAIQKTLGLSEEPSLPLVAMITRLTEQKGLDLVQRMLGEMLQEPLQMVVLGVGEAQYENTLRYFAGQYPEKMSACLMFDESFSHQLYAGADILLMPSQFEPCGLAQLIAMRYGTLPVVRETGGLRDSVIPYNQYTGEGTGFSFANYNAHEMRDAVMRAVTLYREDPAQWRTLMEHAMAQDFSWARSAGEYLALYQSLCPETGTPAV